MIRIGKHILIKGVYIVIDVVFMGLAIYLACSVRPYPTLPFIEITFQNLFFVKKVDELLLD